MGKMVGVHIGVSIAMANIVPTDCSRSQTSRINMEA